MNKENKKLVVESLFIKEAFKFFILLYYYLDNNISYSISNLNKLWLKDIILSEC